MKRNRLQELFAAPDLFEVLAQIALLAAGMTGAGFALFIGKVYAALLIAAVCFGAFLRFKRGRIRKN